MKNIRYSSAYHQRGLTLIEIMVATTISLILLAGVLEIFTSSKQTYRMQDGMSRLQENARFAMHFLTRDARMAGYTGCSSASVQTNNIVDLDGDGTADSVSDFTTAGLFGYEYGDLPITLTATDTLTTADVVNGTDIVVILRGTNQDVQLTGNMTSDNANIQLGASATGLFTANDIMFISDCEASDVFAANNVSSGGTITISHSSAVNTGPKLSKAYGPDAQVMTMEKTAYYIGTNANGLPTLYRKRMVGQGMVTEELVEGVESMQIQYGEDLTGDGIPNRYVNATNVTDMTNVMAIRFSLLLSSAEEVVLETDTSTYNVLDVVVDPTDDRRLRRTFTTTVKLRNRGTI